MDIQLSAVKGLGPARLKALEQAGITTVRALINLLPVDYRDMTDIRPLGSLNAGDVAAVRVYVEGAAREARAGRLLITRARVTDGTATVNAVWYNQPWLKRSIRPDGQLLLYGRLEKRNGSTQLTSPSIEHEEAIIPIYRQIAGIPGKALRQAIVCALDACDGQWKEELPEPLRRRYGLCERNFAMRAAHQPQSREALKAARTRLAFEELLCYQVALGLMRTHAGAGVKIDCTLKDAQAFWAAQPYAPTGAQSRVLEEIIRDMAAPEAMARLVQGDVGCGKTALAFGAIYAAAAHGWQSALMAPTEILATQHYESARALLAPLGVNCRLVTGSMKAGERREARQAIASGECNLAIGTHALISQDMLYHNLGLVITDEQHRFGVRQRAQLGEKGASPNVLVMSATPIPRTLALILYGDLDVSVVDELPPGRKGVKTRIVPEDRRAGMYQFIAGQAALGRQTYVVCPLVDASEAVEARSAEEVYESLRSGPLKALRLGLVHGKMRPADKDRILEDFHAGRLDVLVSTTVIEVGVNVPNATIMAIENAERFGLAQLHQLRGRVGRGAEESWCFLLAEPTEKLRMMTQTGDGFIIAQKDMEMRGPGELLGLRQSGSMTMGISNFAADTQLLKQTHDEARAILKTPHDEQSRAVIELARGMFSEYLEQGRLN